jgi:hypothetical protein
MSHQQEERTDYRSYLLRLWRTHSGEGPVWRVTLEETLTQEIWRFDDLPALFGFLRMQTAAGIPESSGDLGAAARSDRRDTVPVQSLEPNKESI